MGPEQKHSGRTFALHTANLDGPGSIPNIPYGSMSLSEPISEH